MVSGIATFGAASQLKDASTGKSALTTGEAAFIGLAVAGVTAAVESWDAYKQREQAETHAIARAERELQDRFTSTLQQTKLSYLQLAQRKGWHPSEIGWELDRAHTDAVIRMQQRGDVDGMTREYERQRSLRPRDPSLRFGYNYFKACKHVDSADSLAQVAEDTYQARHLIPGHEVYQPDRAAYVYFAATYMSIARDVELCSGPTSASTSTSRRALELWNECYRLNPGDAEGSIRQSRAMAMLEDGDYAGARRDMLALVNHFENDPLFAYQLGRAFSRTGNLKESFAMIRSALVRGGTDVWQVRLHPDLAPLRQGMTNQIKSLVTPKWSWKIVEGWFNDDVALVNNSSFAITGVRLSVTVKKGATRRAVTLNCPIIQPGKSHTWSNAIIAVSGKWDNSTATLTCNESE